MSLGTRAQERKKKEKRGKGNPSRRTPPSPSLSGRSTAAARRAPDRRPAARSAAAVRRAPDRRPITRSAAAARRVPVARQLPPRNQPRRQSLAQPHCRTSSAGR